MAVITFQGAVGAFSYIACKELFPEDSPRGCQSFGDAMELVKSGEADYAIIPVDNSYAGRVMEVYNILPASGLYIVGEYFMPIHHCLLMPTKAVKGTPPEDASMEELIKWKDRAPTQEEIENAMSRIKEIRSHPQGLAQCQKFVRKNLSYARQKEAWDTAGAARDIIQLKARDIAAIGPSGATRYSMTILRENIEDDMFNTTRFLVLSQTPLKPEYIEEEAISTFVFQTLNVPGSLVNVLNIFKKYDVNLSKLETYMMGERHSQPHFYVDVEINPTTEVGQAVYNELKEQTLEVHCLGTYPKSKSRTELY